ncbi:MAG: hypothetical protein ACE5EF_03755, partial [Dehalococcoidia bacterium]
MGLEIGSGGGPSGRPRAVRVAGGLAALAAVLGLPLLGAALAGASVDSRLAFPPATDVVEKPGFSWWAAGPLLVAGIATVAAAGWRVIAVGRSGDVRPSVDRRFPWWGWVGFALMVVAWTVAWMRPEVLGPLQRHTFTPLWLGYVLTMGGLTFYRAGSCLMVRSPRLVGSLFLLSALFWWVFEYLNRFVQNWNYQGPGEMSGLEYFLMATPPFATVLPAVTVSTELLATWPRLRRAFAVPLPEDAAVARPFGAALIMGSAVGLLGMGAWPDYVFPLVWVAPLLLLSGVSLLRSGRLPFAPCDSGGWPVLLPCVAALVCGFFWEMWNAGSLAHWEYSVPFVQRWLLFEMPALGYLGYLPFGLECVAVAALLP